MEFLTQQPRRRKSRAGTQTRRWFGLPWLVLGALSSWGAASQEASPYKSHRFDDDFTYLRDSAQREDFWDPIKYVPIGGLTDAYVTFGGEFRERLDHYDSPLFNLRGVHTQNDALSRLLLSADVHLTPYLRTFFQIGSEFQSGKGVLVAPNDQDHLDLQQGFVELDDPIGDRSMAALRVGRQEIAFGSQRLIAVGEPLNVRRSLDSIRAFYTAGDQRLDAFIGRPVAPTPGVFDDAWNRDQLLWGLYYTTKVPRVSGLGLDLYYLGLDRHNATFSGVTAQEKRHTVGTRLWGKAAGFDYNAEFMGQFGHFGDRRIRAWGVSIDSGYTFEHVALSPRASLKFDLLTGDHNAKDKTVGTFNGLFSQYGYFGDSNLVVPSNLINVYPNATVHVAPNVSVTGGLQYLWRESTHDAFYRIPLVPLVTPAQSRSRYIGEQATLEATWQVGRHFTVYGAYAHFFAGNVIHDAKGRDVDYVSTRLSYKF